MDRAGLRDRYRSVRGRAGGATLKNRKEEDYMRIFVLAFVGAFSLAAGFHPAVAAPFAANSSILIPISKSVPTASPNCGKGQRWVPAGYAKHGKYRVGHCAPK